MAKWILNQPEEHCSEGEVRVARALKKLLPNDWVVRWGFHYEDQQGTQREGDFLILAPVGGILVLEVKGGKLKHFSPTGRWEGEDGANPISQLDKEWIAVINRFRDAGVNPPFVAKALGLPSERAEDGKDVIKGVSRDVILSGDEMEDAGLFQQALLRLFKRAIRNNALPVVSKEQREAFLNLYGTGSSPREISDFLEHNESRFRHQLVSEYRMLDMLEGNQQLLVEGGCGTGKSWYAMEQVRRYVSQGQRVLLLAYNRALTAKLRNELGHDRSLAESVTVKNFEELAALVLGQPLEVLILETSADKQALSQFYDVELPSLVLEALRNPSTLALLPKYDALVVDEGQDHDTDLDETVASKYREAANGWWSIYWCFLNEGTDAPMSIFYDESQRPGFRSKDGFQVGNLRSQLSQPVHVKLSRSIRYTRPLISFLRTLRGPGSEALVDQLGTGGELPEGPDVEIVTTSSSGDALAAELLVIINRWEENGLCDGDDILLLHARSTLDQSMLGERDWLGPYRFSPHDSGLPGIKHCSIHRAKGLDGKAVILIGAKHPDDETMSEYERETLFMGASRARQLLAVVV